MSTQHDRMTRFLLPAAGVRGVHVVLGPAWARIAAADDYAPPVRALLGEATAAAALFAAHAKVEGRLSVQARGTGTLRTLFAECTSAGTVRGIARVADGADAPGEGLAALGDAPVLAITIENTAPGGREPMRYQGLVPLDADTLAGAFEGYFERSEQLPTRLLLATGPGVAAGVMLQVLPGEGDDEGWNRTGHLFATLGADELLATPGDVLLHRLFHEEAVEIVAGEDLAFGCSCSRGRVEGMLQSLGRAEAEAALVDGVAEVRCEFCGEAYRFDAREVHALFTPVARPMDAPPGLQ
jgi:molecular chaperone Hsp33